MRIHTPPRIPMNRRSFLKATGVSGLTAALPTAAVFATTAQQNPKPAPATETTTHKKPGSDSPQTILLKDYRPKSIYKIPVTEVAKAKFPIIDMHSHPYAETPAQIAQWIRNMEEVNV